jgi:uncharacterized protein
LAVYFVDSSALVKRYISETGSAWVSGLFDPLLANEVFIAPITPVEILAAIARRARGGTITQSDAATASNLFRTDLQADCLLVEFTDNLLQSAMNLAEGHGLRGYDAVQLAAALEIDTICRLSGLPSLVFVSADVNLNAVATTEGLQVDNPNLHP